MINAHIFAPEARRRQLVIQELADEVLIYDLETNRAFCLNPTAAFVWKHCDGQNSLSRIAGLLSKKLKTSIEETVVWFALRELEQQDLLAKSVAAFRNGFDYFCAVVFRAELLPEPRNISRQSRLFDINVLPHSVEQFFLFNYPTGVFHEKK